jgi:ubiquinone/menaquinone biosynthesis C-methylase UbiE
MKIKTDWKKHLQKIRDEEIEIIFSKCPKDLFENALELGAGNGYQSYQITNYTKKLFSTDFHSKILINQNTERINYSVCDAENLTKFFAQTKFDFIYSSNLLEHLPNIGQALSEMSRLLKDDAIMVHIVPSVFWKFSNFFLYHLNIATMIFEALTTKGGMTDLKSKYKDYDNPQTGNNPKLETKKKSPLRLLLPQIHGISKSNYTEFSYFRKKKWIKRFEQAGFTIIKIKNGPVASGWGFGFDRLRNICKKLGFTSENIFIMCKNPEKNQYKEFF